MPMSELQGFLVEEITRYVAESPLNRLKDIDGSPIFEEPLVGFADGDDPLFDLYKKVVGEFHLTPREALAKQVKEQTGSEPPEFEQVGVVSWVLPIASRTRKDNREMSDGPSLRWNHTRFQGEDFNDNLRRHLVSLLEGMGYRAVAPMLASFFNVFDLPNGRASNWSERHVAYAAGHGTFSLSDGLITARGMAHRCGSVVVNTAFEPSSREYSHHLEYCLGANGGSCLICARRCPAGAIGPNGHNKLLCREWIYETQADWVKKPGYIGSYGGCGLCQTGVPCESGIPTK
jgi:epoxyqueuosine reductase